MAQTEDEKPTCFIAMPITTLKEEAEQYGDEHHWDHVMRSLHMPAIEAAGMKPVVPIAKGTTLIHEGIIKNLSECDLVLVDLSRLNPNVLFELGVRTSLNKPIALVYDKRVTLPFDTSGMNTHDYKPALHGWEMGDEIKRLAEHLTDSVETCEGENPLWRRFGLSFKAQEPTSPESPTEAKLDLLVDRVLSLDAEISQMNARDDNAAIMERHREVLLRDEDAALADRHSPGRRFQNFERRINHFAKNRQIAVDISRVGPEHAAVRIDQHEPLDRVREAEDFIIGTALRFDVHLVNLASDEKDGRGRRLT